MFVVLTEMLVPHTKKLTQLTGCTDRWGASQAVLLLLVSIGVCGSLLFILVLFNGEVQRGSFSACLNGCIKSKTSIDI